MKIRFEVDLTPEEFREAFGLPDVEKFYDEVMSSILEKMRTGEEGYDPFSLMQPLVKNGFTNMEKAQETILAMMAGYMNTSNKKA